MTNKVMIILIFLCSMLVTVSGFALTPQQIIELKKAGVSERTIQMMIMQEEGKDPYSTIGTREVKDKDGNTVIVYSTGENSNSIADEEEKKNMERAWQMLNNMIIIKK